MLLILVRLFFYFFSFPSKDKQFWKTLKPIFAGKSTNVSDKIVLIEKGSIISKDEDIANIFNSYFVNITDTLPTEKPILPSNCKMSDPVLHAIETYKDHPSIIKIKSTVLVQERFEFGAVCPGDFWNEINQLASSKKSSGCIPTDILKLISEPYSNDIANYINMMFQSGMFPDILKLEDVSPIFKCDDAFVKTNFRPISILSAISKVFERCMSKQVWPFDKSSIIKSVMRVSCRVQHTSCTVSSSVVKKLDENYTIGMVLMDLSKAYDCLPHDLLIAKLEAYGFGIHSLRLIASYLSNRKLRVKIGSTTDGGEWFSNTCTIQ